MLSTTQSITITGNSKIAVDGKETVAMTMNATIGEKGSISITKTIQDKGVYLANTESVDTDAKGFEDYVKSMMEV